MKFGFLPLLTLASVFNAHALDEANLWRRVGSDFKYPIYAAAFDAQGNILVGTGSTQTIGHGGGGLWKSTDNGQSWSRMENELRDSSVSNLVVLPDGKLIAGSYRIFQSSDNGDHWTKINAADSTSGYFAVGPAGKLF